MDYLPVNVLHGKAGAHQIETVEARVLPLKEVILPRGQPIILILIVISMMICGVIMVVVVVLMHFVVHCSACASVTIYTMPLFNTAFGGLEIRRAPKVCILLVWGAVEYARCLCSLFLNL